VDISTHLVTQWLGIAFISALLIERILQMLKALLNYLEARKPKPDYWNLRAVNLTQSYLNAQQSAPDFAELLGRRYLLMKQHEDSPENQHLMVDANRIRQLATRGRLKVLGIILGITLAFILDLNLIDLIPQAQEDTSLFICSDDNPECAAKVIHNMLGKLVIGIGLGLGATPLHEMIARLERAYKTVKTIKG
jgi:hypothetical protein